MEEAAEMLARYRKARAKPRRAATEAGFRRACRVQGWGEEEIERCLAKARRGAWFEVGGELLCVKGPPGGV